MLLLKKPALVATLATVSLAATDSMAVVYCGGSNYAFLNKGTCFTDFGANNINTNDGCRGTPMASINRLCIDNGHFRAHFEATGQPKRYLQRRAHSYADWCGGPDVCGFEVWT